VTTQSLLLFEFFTIYDKYEPGESTHCQQCGVQRVPLDCAQGAL